MNSHQRELVAATAFVFLTGMSACQGNDARPDDSEDVGGRVGESNGGDVDDNPQGGNGGQGGKSDRGGVGGGGPAGGAGSVGGRSEARSPDAGAAKDTGEADAASDTPTKTTGCRGSTFADCLDFESGALPAAWTATKSDNPTVQKGRAAKGEYALHFSRLKTEKPLIRRGEIPGITSVLWGRMFMYVTPAMPEGHGALVAAFDESSNWYEVGFQFRNYHGNWHVPAGVPERWMNSQVKVPSNRWVCVEWSFDGAKPDVTRIWSDGKEVAYNQSATAPGPLKVQKFKKIEIGFTPYHGSDMTDMWIDELALGNTRIGCD